MLSSVDLIQFDGVFTSLIWTHAAHGFTSITVLTKHGLVSLVAIAQRVKTNCEVCVFVVCDACLQQTVIVPNEKVGPLSSKTGDCHEL